MISKKIQTLIFGVMGGFALAASIELRDSFATQFPALFYAMHGAFVAAISAWLIYKLMHGQATLIDLVRNFVPLLGLYGIAWTQSPHAPLAVTLTALVLIVLRTIRSDDASKMPSSKVKKELVR